MVKEKDRDERQEYSDYAFTFPAIREFIKVYGTGEFSELYSWYMRTRQVWDQRYKFDSRHVNTTLYANLPQSKKPLEVVRHQLRARRNDGTGEGWFKTSMSGTKEYGGPENALEPDQIGAELSFYALNPSIPLDVNKEMFIFRRNPFENLKKCKNFKHLHSWIKMWLEVMNSEYITYPGYYCKEGIPRASSAMLAESGRFLLSQKYTHMTAVPTWFHTLKSFLNKGFAIKYAKDADRIAELEEKLRQFLPYGIAENASPQEKHKTYAQLSWIVMLQFAVEFIEKSNLHKKEKIELLKLVKDYILTDAQGNLITYVLTEDYNFWIEYELTEESVGRLQGLAEAKNDILRLDEPQILRVNQNILQP